jgi:predicted AAA+ superfamily ATPase
MEHLRHIVESILIPHTAYQEAISCLEQCVKNASGCAEGSVAALFAPSRTGKTRLLEELRLQFPGVRNEEGLEMRVLYVNAPALPTPKGLLETILLALGDEIHKKKRVSENQETDRLIKLIKSTGLIVIIIDEFQHFVDKGTRHVLYVTADWLKRLVDETRITLIVAGLPTAAAVFSQNEQLAGRCQARVELPQFRWSSREHQVEFIAIVEAFHDALSEHFDLPPLDNDELAFRMYFASGGLMGYLTKLLRKAVWDAVDNTRDIIRLEDLGSAFKRAVWAPEYFGNYLNPFSREFPSTPTEDMLRAAEAVGMHVEVYRPTSRRPRKVV